MCTKATRPPTPLRCQKTARSNENNNNDNMNKQQQQQQQHTTTKFTLITMRA
jgi:hypothetical protein